ncbi:unnamed protein product, partial [Rotaria magnacalcarata]
MVFPKTEMSLSGVQKRFPSPLAN